MVLVISTESVVSRVYLCYTQDYMTAGICSLIKPTAMEKLMSFPTQIHMVMLQLDGFGSWNPSSFSIVSWHWDGFGNSILTHWGRVTHICVSELTIISSDNGLLPGRRQAIIWTNAGILLIRPLGTNFSEILIEIYTFSYTKIHLKLSSGNGGHFASASMS